MRKYNKYKKRGGHKILEMLWNKKEKKAVAVRCAENALSELKLRIDGLV